MKDPAIERQAAWAPSLKITPGRIGFARRMTSLLERVNERLPSGVMVADRVAAGVPVRHYAHPELRERASAAVVYVHGGGLILGGHEWDNMCGSMALAADVPVFSVDYRLAPEHRFPAALDDIVSATRAIRDAAPQLGVDPDRIIISGASAGAGLAAAAAQRLTDEGVKLAGQLLVYPMLDDRTAARKDITDEDLKVWTQTSNATGWSSYLGLPPGADVVPEYAVPARRDDLSGLPPAWIGVGTRDLFHDECLAYAESLKSAGVDTELYIVEGAVHGFDTLVPSAPEATAAFQTSQYEFIARVSA